MWLPKWRRKLKTVTLYAIPLLSYGGTQKRKKLILLGSGGALFRRVLNEAQRDLSMDSTSLRCWLHQYSRSVFYPNSTARAANTTLFLQGLQRYLEHDTLSLNDLRFDSSSTHILASRCYILSVNEVSRGKREQAHALQRSAKSKSSLLSIALSVPRHVFLRS